MTSTDVINADEILERLFAVVLQEARTRPEFAVRLIEALPKGAIAKIEKPSPRKKKPSFDPNALSLVAIMESEGEKGLRQRLNPINRKAQLRSIAEAQHISIDEKIYKKPLATIRDAIVEGVKSRIANRLAAAS